MQRVSDDLTPQRMADIQMSLKYSGGPCKHAVMQTRLLTHFLCSTAAEYLQRNSEQSALKRATKQTMEACWSTWHSTQT